MLRYGFKHVPQGQTNEQWSIYDSRRDAESVAPKGTKVEELTEERFDQIMAASAAPATDDDAGRSGRAGSSHRR